MIIKEPQGQGYDVTVTFSLPASDREVWVAGDFNRWSPTATPLADDGETASASVILNAGRRYAFRYVDQDKHWFDDDDADDFESNSLGGTNSVVDLTLLPLAVDDPEPETTAPAAGSAAGWLWPIEKAVAFATAPVARVTRLLRNCR